jgi:CheY-like chemotaxis protein
MDGLDLLNVLRSNFPSTPLIFVAEDSAKETILSAFRSGAHDYLEKPVDEHSFAEVLHRATLFADKRDKSSNTGAKRGGKRLKNIFTKIFSTRKKSKHDQSKSSCIVEEALILDLQNQNLKLKKIVDYKDKVKSDTETLTRLEIVYLGKFRVIFNGQPLSLTEVFPVILVKNFLDAKLKRHNSENFQTITRFSIKFIRNISIVGNKCL